MKKKIFVDFDDTLVDSTSVIVDIYNKVYGETADVRLLKSFDLLDQCPRFGESHGGDYQAEMADFYSCDEFWNNLKPKPNAIDVMNKLKADGFEIVMVSYGDAANLVKKVVYAKQMFPMLDGYIFLSQHQKPFTKRDVNMDGAFFIDDYSHYLNESNAATKIMFSKDVRGNRNPGYFSSTNWLDVYKYVHHIYNANKELGPELVPAFAVAN